MRACPKWIGQKQTLSSFDRYCSLIFRGNISGCHLLYYKLARRRLCRLLTDIGSLIFRGNISSCHLLYYKLARRRLCRLLTDISSLIFRGNISSCHLLYYKLARGRFVVFWQILAASSLEEIFPAVTYCIINWLEADLSSFDRYWQPHLYRKYFQLSLTVL